MKTALRVFRVSQVTSLQDHTLASRAMFYQWTRKHDQSKHDQSERTDSFSAKGRGRWKLRRHAWKGGQNNLSPTGIFVFKIKCTVDFYDDFYLVDHNWVGRYTNPCGDRGVCWVLRGKHVNSPWVLPSGLSVNTPSVQRWINTLEGEKLCKIHCKILS